MFAFVAAEYMQLMKTEAVDDERRNWSSTFNPHHRQLFALIQFDFINFRCR